MNNILIRLKKFIIKNNNNFIFYICILTMWIAGSTLHDFSNNSGYFRPSQFEEISIPNNTVMLLISGGTRSEASDSFLFYYQGKKHYARCIREDIKNPKNPCSKFNLKPGTGASIRGKK
ncbi:hypothetical protein [Stenoxybacter acetivorans]|uniref:hypothetical protein n=1 Tax=Stenoxybacter acetivorans TaxID=422441 RepID=UPI0012EBAD3F|nr:hypothetical protein [Stenoxybacter acetivorans]